LDITYFNKIILSRENYFSLINLILSTSDKKMYIMKLT